MREMNFTFYFRLMSQILTHGEVTALKHELRNNSVETRTLIVKRFTRGTSALLTSAQTTEIFCADRSYIASELEGNSTRWGTIDGDIKKHIRTRVWGGHDLINELMCKLLKAFKLEEQRNPSQPSILDLRFPINFGFSFFLRGGAGRGPVRLFISSR